MIKRYVYAGLFAVVFAGLVILYLLMRMEKITPAKIVQAVPADAMIFVENADYEFFTENFLRQNRIWIDFLNTSGQMKLDSAINGVLGRLAAAEDLQDLLLKEGFSLSLHLIGKDQIVPLLYIPYGDKFSDHDFEQLAMSLWGEEDMVNERRYDTESLFDVSGSPGSIAGKLTFASVNGICLVSPSAMLVEEAVRTLHEGTDRSEDPGLQLIRGTAGKYVHANIYMDYSRISQLFKPFLKEDKWALLEGLSYLASWGELDLDIKGDAVIMNGMTLAEEEQSFFLDVFADQTPVKMEIHELMPSGTAYFLHFGISDPETFRKSLTAYLERKGEWPAIAGRASELKKTYGVDPFEDLFRVLDNEIAWFGIEGETTRMGDGVLLVETKSQSETTEMVKNWLQQYLQVHAFDMSSYKTVYHLDEQTSFDIYKMPDFYSGGTIGGRIFNRYVAVYENCLLFGPSVSVISRVIYQNILHKTLVSDAVFREMSDYISNRGNLTLFIRPFPWLETLRGILNDHTIERLGKLELFLRRVPGLVVQYSSEESLLYQSISFKYTSQITEKAMTVWESLLDTVAVMKPALVINHNTMEKEIFIQDASGRIYLINGTGRILWDQLIGGPIMGEVYQVDFYKNGKLQYLFNTKEKLYLIDRNGNFVERYPVALRSPATSPMALFDYDGNRNYRIFLTGEDRKVYVYDLEGDIVTGWKFGKTESVVHAAPQHFRMSDRDYIVLADKSRGYFLDRQGRERIKPKERIVFSTANAFYLDMNIREDRPRWVSTDTAGNVICIYMDGEVSTLLKHQALPDHFFQMQDMDLDGVPDYIFAENDEVTVLAQDGKRLFSYRVRGRISDSPDIYKFSASDIKIGITDRSRNRIYLVNSDGSLYEGFPLEGSTRFSIGYFAGSDSRFNLIVGSANNFLYNYSIE